MVAPARHNSQCSLTAKLLRGEKPGGLFRRLAAALSELDASILKLLIFGATEADAEAGETMRDILQGMNCPVTWVEGGSCDGRLIAGVQVLALTGGTVRRIVRDGQVVGSVFEEGGARQCILGGLVPGDIRSSRADQTRATLEDLQAALAQAGFAFGDVIRTWFYLDDIRAWYADFNRVRTEMYAQFEFRSGSPPASTGVAGRNPAKAALVAGAWAVQPADPALQVREVASPLQCPPTAYHSCFSRAMEIRAPQSQRLLVSGTASVGREGETLHAGDAQAQVAQTMKSVIAILESRGLSLANVTRATAYFAAVEHAPLFAEWLSGHGRSALPVVCVGADICRPDLLFEIELDAARRGR